MPLKCSKQGTLSDILSNSVKVQPLVKGFTPKTPIKKYERKTVVKNDNRNYKIPF